MSARPLIQPKWAATATFSTPSSGKQNAGWRTGERPPAGYLNWGAFWTWKWIEWLDEGDCQFHDLSATGATTLGTLAVGGDATITGRVIATGPNASLDLRNTGDSSKRIRLQAPASLSADQTWTLPSALPSSSRAALHVDSTGAVTADRYSINVSAANAQLTSVGLSGPATFDGTAWFLGTSGAAQGPVFDIPLPTGETITAWKALGTKNSASGTITATFTVRNMATGATVITGTATNSASAPGSITLTGSTGSLPFLIPDAHSLTVVVQGGGVTGDSIRGVTVTF